MEETRPAAYLPDDLVVEILSRLPAKSLCRFKCVSRSWLALITDPARRRRFAQTLSGIFFSRGLRRQRPLVYCTAWGFAALSTPPPHAWGHGDDDSPLVNNPALPFLPSICGDEVELLDSCNGLLLLLCSPPQEARGGAAASSPPPPPDFYVVCNPATGEWVALPQPSVEPGYHGFSEECEMISTKYATLGEMISTRYAALGFDPSVSSHFHVFQIMEEQYQTEYLVKAVEIYSSETGAWVLRDSGWKPYTCVKDHSIHFNGFQHFTTMYSDSVAMVDSKGQTWRMIKLPDYVLCYSYGFLGHSRGCLLYVDYIKPDNGWWAVYALEDHGGEEWTLKHRISNLLLFGSPELHRGPMYCVVAFHPDCDWILFYDQQRRSLMCYDMGKGDVRVVCTLAREVARHSYPFLPYVPMYLTTLASSPPDVNVLEVSQ